MPVILEPVLSRSGVAPPTGSGIVLISGDSDFVPVAKTARREGIRFTLDPMWNPIKTELREHADNLRCNFPRPNAQK